MDWSSLTEEQYLRLCECRSRHSDVVPIARAYMINKKCDAEMGLELAFEHLDMNGQFWDPTNEEYDAMLRKLERMQND